MGPQFRWGPWSLQLCCHASKMDPICLHCILNPLGLDWTHLSMAVPRGPNNRLLYSRQSRGWTTPLSSSISCLQCSSFSSLSSSTHLSGFLGTSVLTCCDMIGVLVYYLAVLSLSAIFWILWKAAYFHTWCLGLGHPEHTRWYTLASDCNVSAVHTCWCIKCWWERRLLDTVPRQALLIIGCGQT